MNWQLVIEHLDKKAEHALSLGERNQDNLELVQVCSITGGILGGLARAFEAGLKPYGK